MKQKKAKRQEILNRLHIEYPKDWLKTESENATKHIADVSRKV